MLEHEMQTSDKTEYLSVNGTAEKDPHQFARRTDSKFRDRLHAAIAKAVTDYYTIDLRMAVPENAIAQTEYEGAFGAYILEQLPYASLDDLVLPAIPSTPDNETRWVRKAGVLRKHTAFTPLPSTETIPAGEYTPFTYEDWPYLKDDLAETETPAGDPTTAPHDHRAVYPHNIIKTIRFRYTVRNRKHPGDWQRAYIVMKMSGADGQ